MRLWHSIRKIGKWQFITGLSIFAYATLAAVIGLVIRNTLSFSHAGPTKSDVVLIALSMLAIPVVILLGWFRQESSYQKYADRLKGT